MPRQQEVNWMKPAGIASTALGGLAFLASAVVSGDTSPAAGFLAGLLNPLFFIGVPLGIYWLKTYYEVQHKSFNDAPEQRKGEVLRTSGSVQNEVTDTDGIAADHEKAAAKPELQPSATDADAEESTSERNSGQNASDERQIERSRRNGDSVPIGMERTTSTVNARVPAGVIALISAIVGGIVGFGIGSNSSSRNVPNSSVARSRTANHNLPVDYRSRSHKSTSESVKSKASEVKTPPLLLDDTRGENVVRAGSFTVWAVPDPPRPREPYYVFIRVKVPKEMRGRYPVTDLSGDIQGNDRKFGGVDYRQSIPFDPKLSTSPYEGFRKHVFRLDPYSNRFKPVTKHGDNKFLPVVDGYATVAIKVPGAVGEHVQDKIKITSKVHDETRRISLGFRNRERVKRSKRKKATSN